MMALPMTRPVTRKCTTLSRTEEEMLTGPPAASVDAVNAFFELAREGSIIRLATEGVDFESM